MSSVLLPDRQLSSMIRNLDHGAFIYRPDDQLFVCNKLFNQIIENAPKSGAKVPPEELLERVANAFEKHRELKEALKEKLEGGEEKVSLLHKSKKGELILINVSFFEGAGATFLLVALSNLSEIHEAISVLSKQEEKYRIVVENMNLGVLEVDKEGIIVEAFPKFCEITGYSREELIGKSANSTLLYPDDIPIMKEQEAQRLQGISGSYEVRLRRKDGRIIWVSISGTPVLDDQGNLVGSFGIHMDITPLKATEAELIRQHKNAMEAKKAKESLMANLSHEMRTPINGILGLARLILDEHEIAYDTRVKLQSLLKTAGHLQFQVEELLDFAEIEKGGIRIESQPFDLRFLMDNIQFIYKEKEDITGNRMLLQYDESLPETLMGDPIKIGQALRKLLDNAFKFCTDSKIRVCARKISENHESCEVELCVRDTGPGIPRNELKQIFHAFYQLEQNEMIHEGMGLGLPMAKLIIDKMGGELELISKPGEGTDAVIYLRLGKLQEQNTPSRSQKRPEDIRILIAEDNEINSMIFQEHMNRWGFRFDAVADGLAVIEKMKKTNYDMVLMDIQLPGISGIEACKMIRKELPAPYNEIPILALTAYAYSEDREKCLEAGMDDFITKPFTPLHLFHKMTRLLALQWQSPESPEEKIEHGECNEILDIQSFKIYTRNDPVLQKNLLGSFIADTPKMLREMDELFLAQRRDELARLVHKLKPSISLMGIRKAIPIIEDLNRNLKNGTINLDELEPAVRSLRKSCEEGMEALKEEFRNLA